MPPNEAACFGGVDFWSKAEYRDQLERDRDEMALEQTEEDPAYFVVTRLDGGIAEFFRDWEHMGSRSTAIYTCGQCKAAGCVRSEGAWYTGRRAGTKNDVWYCNERVQNCSGVLERMEQANYLIRSTVG